MGDAAVKKTPLFAFLILVLAPVALADYTLPDSVYRMNRLEAAKSKAVKDGMAIAFLYTREKTGCPKAKTASLKAADQLGDLAVVVYADCDKEWNLLPKIVKTALRSSESGEYVPKVVVVDAKIKKVISIVPYAGEAEHNGLLQKARAKIYAETNK